jgi:hypothetical protein
LYMVYIPLWFPMAISLLSLLHFSYLFIPYIYLLL